MDDGRSRLRVAGAPGAADVRLVDLAHEPMAVLDRRGLLRRVNQAVTEVTGWPQHELVGRPLADALHPDDRERVTVALAALVDGGPPLEGFAVRSLSPAGQVRWLGLRARHDRQLDLVVATARDLGGEAERAVTGLAQTFAASPAGFALILPDGRIHDVNPALCRMLGRTRDQLVGREIAELEVGRARDEVARERRAMLEGALPGYRVDRRFRHAEGHVVVGRVVGTLVRDPGGAPLAYACVIEDVSRARMALDRLADNEAKLAEAQQIARLGSWEWDVVEDRVTWSDELHRIYGVPMGSPPDAYGDALDRVHPADRSRVAREVGSAIVDGEGWATDYRVVRPDGEVVHVHARGDVVLGPDGTPVLVRGTCQDVTERRRVEDALRSAEQLFRRAFDDAPIGMALLDGRRRWLRVNPSVSRMLGRDEEDLRGHKLDELVLAADRELDAQPLRELLEGRRQSYAVEKRLRHADGSTIHVVQHVSLLLGDDVSFLCQLVDVTESRRAEADRRAGEVRLQAIVDNAPAVIFVKDPALRYVLVNRRWEALYGVGSDEVVGRTASEVLDPDEAVRVEQLDLQVLETARDVEVLARVHTAAGSPVEFLSLQFPIFDDDGRVSGVCGIATDVTERRRSTTERAELERRLAQSQRLETVGRLAGGVAHDFNNLLSVIITCAGFALKEAAPGSPVREDVEEIERAAQRAARLVRQLLIFSRREVVQPEVVDLGDLVEDLDGLLRRSLTERVQLVVVREDGVPPVLADPARIEQVLLNLVINARDALAEEGGTIRVVVTRSPSGGARVQVCDDGPGMEPDVAERAFEPFFTTKASGEGTGLGLATVQGIVADSGGAVDLETAPGAGTTITVDLPGTDEAARGVAPVGPVATRAHGSGRILLVEDQTPVRAQARRILEAAGYAVVEAADGDEALERIDETVDLLLTDVVMPGMSGQEVADRAVELHPRLRVVFMSGHTEDVVVREGVREGGVAFVQKPFNEAALLQAVLVALAPEGIA
ncbi:PAS domain S-box protein [Conexibacter sp. SYSU D00693]|uniref:PAS domain S-box protein n=1 Tax=Conexibacter sp. SYSU D00693 TaxID=2812560 RepID=UPI00196B63AB|nr:PAS domain S-box protein [Conexibacter sp. SYSU D00693]